MDDYAKTIFLYYYRKPRITIEKESDGTGYFNYLLKISDPKQYQSMQERDGYLVESTIDVALKTQTLTKLKKVLTDNDIKPKGNKDDIIYSILENFDKGQIKKIIPYRVLQLTEKGEEWLTKHEHYIYIKQHPNWNLDYREIDSLLLSMNKGNINGRWNYKDVIWSIFNKRYITEPETYHYQTHLNQYEFMMEKGKKDIAAQSLLDAFAMQVSGLAIINYMPMTDESLKEHIKTIVLILDNNKHKLIELREYITQKMIDNAYKIGISVKLCSYETFDLIIKALMSDRMILEGAEQLLYKDYTENMEFD